MSVTAELLENNARYADNFKGPPPPPPAITDPPPQTPPFVDVEPEPIVYFTGDITLNLS